MTFGQSVTDIELSPHKLLLHAENLKILAGGGDVFPVTVELDLVNHCNHRCGWCVDPSHGRDRLNADFARRLLGELRALGVLGIVFKGGGEPTLHESFGDLLGFARGAGFETGIVTNGSRLDRFAEPIALHASYLRVSIDGPTPASHRAVHRSRDFARIVAGVELVVSERARRQGRHPVIGLSFAMDFSLAPLVAEAVALGDRLGVDYVLFRTPFFEEVGRPPTMPPSDARQAREAFEAARRAYHGKMKVMIDHWVSDREAAEGAHADSASPRRGNWQSPGVNGIEHVTGRCFASPLLAVVTADRAVYPCCNLRALRGWSAGRIDYEKGIGFREVWRGPRRRKLMERIHAVECLRHCTHPLSRYNEAIEYLRGPQYHGGFV